MALVAFAVLLGLFITPDPADVDDDDDPFTGTWLVNGIDPRGEEYSGTLSILRDADSYALQWIVTGSVLEGDGVREGNMLEATWRAVNRGERTGTATYRITETGLAGTLTLDGWDGTGTEEAFPPR